MELRRCSEISEKRRQKGLPFACESYIHNIMCGQSLVKEENIKIRRKS